jgi:spore germination cell wall hydrolase CwlJ-like protein
MNLRFIKPIVAFVILLGLAYNPVDMITVEDEPAEIVAKVVDPKQLACMAKNIFYEAGNESIMGQAAVARVVLNRVSHGFAKTPCAVVYQAHTVEKVIDEETVKVKLCQFSWVCEDKGDALT